MSDPMNKATKKPPLIDRFWEFDFASDERPFLELSWLIRHGAWSFGRNGGLTFGAGRLWYDGPHWYVHFGFWSASLECK